MSVVFYIIVIFLNQKNSREQNVVCMETWFEIENMKTYFVSYIEEAKGLKFGNTVEARFTSQVILWDK